MVEIKQKDDTVLRALATSGQSPTPESTITEAPAPAPLATAPLTSTPLATPTPTPAPTPTTGLVASAGWVVNSDGKSVRKIGTTDPTITTTPTTTTSFTDKAKTYSRLTGTEQDAEGQLASGLSNVKTADQIQAEKMKLAQAEIDALNRMFDDKVAEQRRTNLEQDRQTSSISTLTGLAGSTEANVEATKTSALGDKQLEAINNERAVAVNAVLSEIRNNSVEEARLSREEAQQSAKDVLALRTTRMAEAVSKIQLLAGAGVTIDGLKANDPESYEYLVKTLGGEDMLKGYIALNRPPTDIEDHGIKDGVYYSAYRNPVTGELIVETVSLGLPEGYSKTIDAGDRIIAIPDNWDGDPDNLVTINKGLTPDQAADNLRQEGDETSISSDFTRQLQATAQSTILDLRGRVSNLTVAFGSLGSFMPGSPQLDFAADLETLKADIGFGILNQMRAASKTGGALGQVSERELAFLQATLGSLNQKQSVANFNKNLDKIEASIAKWVDAVEEAGGFTKTIGGSESSTLTSPDGTQFVNVSDLTSEELQEAEDAGWI